MTPDTQTQSQRRRWSTRAASQFGRDGRAVSPVIGAILMFGLLISMLVLVQVNAVPAENQQVEFEHNKRVQQDMLNLERAILQSGTEDVPGSAQLELAARYPSRFFLLNPGVGAGTVETLGAETVTISNARAPSADTYWDGSDRTFDTTTLRYRPAYNEYGNAPVTVYEHNTLVNNFTGGAALPVSSGSFIEGDQVTLVLLDGQLSTASTQSVAIETVPLSAPTTSTTITNDGSGDIVIELPTTLTKQQWEDILADEIGPSGRVSSISVADGNPYNTLTVNLKPGEYQLRMARVGVGSGVDESTLGAHYLTRVGDSETESIRGRETKEVTVRINDRYNNHAEGDVTFTATNGWVQDSDGVWKRSITKSSTETGTVSVLFQPEDGFLGTATVTAEQDFDDSGTTEDRETTSFSIPVETTNVTTTTEDSVSRINPSGDGDIVLESVELSNNQKTLSVTFRNNGDEPRQMLQARLLFFMDNSGNFEDLTAKVNNKNGDTIELFGDWEDLTDTQTIEVPADDTVTIELWFSEVGTKDLFGLTIEFEGYTANYFIQVP